ncbi:MAG: hypothetical protein C4583_17825 [Anaerolineaceae bacterium]|nr:MAG: hypothetical protein C4583_17825 [Anaerolineaceae bacterium]
MKDRYSQIKFFAANYTRLQGLRAIPVGLLAVFVSVWVLYNQGPTANLSQPIFVAIIAGLLYLLTDRYYNRVFGQVKPSPSKRKGEIIVSIVIGALALLAFALDTAHVLPISALGLVFAICFLEYFWRVDKYEWKKIFIYFPENIIAAALVAIISILPIFGISVWELAGIQWQTAGVFMIFGIVIMVTGIVGHIRMIRTLSTADMKSNDITVQ